MKLPEATIDFNKKYKDLVFKILSQTSRVAIIGAYKIQGSHISLFGRTQLIKVPFDLYGRADVISSKNFEFEISEFKQAFGTL